MIRIRVLGDLCWRPQFWETTICFGIKLLKYMLSNKGDGLVLEPQICRRGERLRTSEVLG